jgi:hydrogenase maturation protease HycI
MTTGKGTEKKPPRPAWKRRLRSEVAAAGKVLVLGVGNPDKGDDAAGILAAQGLKKAMGGQARRRLKVLLGYETPENLTGEIRKFGPGLVLILDAALGPHPPGTVFLVDKDEIPDEGVSTHKISLKMLVYYLEETLGCTVAFLGIQSADLGLGRPVTKPVERAAKRLSAALAEILRSSSA